MLVAVPYLFCNLINRQFPIFHKPHCLTDTKPCKKIFKRYPQFLFHNPANIRRITANCMCHLSEIQISVLIIGINIFSCVLYNWSTFLHFLHFPAHLTANIRQCFKSTFSCRNKTLSTHFFFCLQLKICTELLKIFRQLFHNNRYILILTGKHTYRMIRLHKFSDNLFKSDLIYFLSHRTFINFLVITGLN